MSFTDIVLHFIFFHILSKYPSRMVLFFTSYMSNCHITTTKRDCKEGNTVVHFPSEGFSIPDQIKSNLQTKKGS